MGLAHSAKGSTWEDHKYIKRKNGTYYYPKSYKGGRHLPDGEEPDSKTSGGSESDEEEKKESEVDENEETKDEEMNESDEEQEDVGSMDLDAEDIEELAKEVIKGNFGNGQERKDLLGENYDVIQKRVNEIMKESKSATSKSGSDSSGSQKTPTAINAEDKRNQKSGSQKTPTAINAEDKRKIQSASNEKRGFVKKTVDKLTKEYEKAKEDKKKVKHSFTAEEALSLYHHGILGMRWGVRRFQNKDGTLTEAGRRRLGQISDNSKKVEFDGKTGKIKDGAQNHANAKAAVHEEAAKDYKNANSAMNSASNLAKNLSQYNKEQAAQEKRAALSKVDLSDMDDKQLQQAINRLNLERNFKNLTSENISTGRERIASILATTGTVLAVGASAMAIAESIHRMRS